MRLQIFLVFLLVAFCLGQEEEENEAQRTVRAPQGHIQYDDSNGYRVSWKLFAPYTQWTSELENIQSSESKNQETEPIPETKTTKSQETIEDKHHQQQQPQQQQQQQQKQHIEPAVEYKPYSMVPTYIKQLIFKMYEPQGPYVDPKVYIYHTPVAANVDDNAKSPTIDNEKNAERRQETIHNHEEIIEPIRKYSYSEQETASQQQRSPTIAQELPSSSSSSSSSSNQDTSKLINEYQNPILKKKTHHYGKYPLKEIGHIEYKKDNEQESKSPQYGFVPQRQTKIPDDSISSSQESITHTTQENIMPTLIQQLLNLQAQIPYYVIANRINYKPKKMFIPKPIAEDDKGAYTYRSKVYYMRDDDNNNEENENKSVDKVTKITPRH
ncbi:myb-like protein Q isoform X2 [Leptopilina boulardi]|uniref:myb-like protein Q isoform X2 n=1 Tax=Leptopilina boulardi TaxID=63433 RepID=UPI0021F53A6F|nr:myb-like protein Q isoform X2 [Leptopilina boulardi]